MIDDLREAFEAHPEWLLLRENGRTFPLLNHEVSILTSGSGAMIEVLEDGGLTTFRVQQAAASGRSLSMTVTSRFGKGSELLRFTPRISDAELNEALIADRIQIAAKVSALLGDELPGAKLRRTALNADNDRIAEMVFEFNDKSTALALAALTDNFTSELFLTISLEIFRKKSSRKKLPDRLLFLAGRKKLIRDVGKLIALFSEPSRRSLRLFEISADRERIVPKRQPRMRDLWRQKAAKISLPEAVNPSETANRILDLDRERIDIVFSKQGETLRFLGLPFARVRRVGGHEKAWFGVERSKTQLDPDSWGQFRELVGELDQHRHAATSDRRHDLYRLAPEAWLESILRRNIAKLDQNLILSPLYNQVRTTSDKLDLLALRRDGRLVIIELKTSPDRQAVFQAADYWRKIELQRRSGELQAAGAFGDREILDMPALVYIAAPALSFHREFERFARMLSDEIELWRFELHQDWRKSIRVLSRKNYAGGFTNL